MNRNNEWEIFFDEVTSYLPPQMNYSAQRAVSRAGKVKIGLPAPVLPFAAVCTVFILFITLINTSFHFIKAINNIPLLGRLAGILSVNPALRAAASARKG